MPPGSPEIMIQVDMHRIARGGPGTFNIWLSIKSEGKRDLVDGRLVPSFFFFFFHGAHGLCSAFLRSLISPKEISPGETHSHADGTIPLEPLSLLLSLPLFPSDHLVLPFSPFCCVAPSYIKQTVRLAALGDIALIFQHWGTGVMQCAAMDTLHENLSLLK